MRGKALGWQQPVRAGEAGEVVRRETKALDPALQLAEGVALLLEFAQPASEVAAHARAAQRRAHAEVVAVQEHRRDLLPLSPKLQELKRQVEHQHVRPQLLQDPQHRAEQLHVPRQLGQLPVDLLEHLESTASNPARTRRDALPVQLRTDVLALHDGVQRQARALALQGMQLRYVLGGGAGGAHEEVRGVAAAAHLGRQPRRRPEVLGQRLGDKSHALTVNPLLSWPVALRPS
mmetsp:Transcript_34409/g.107099  ORF Transcript_34409/g.107099 Transcript_34409/m.107099 type:complete len:233 (+) Transcript_34409:1034-1732(+)